MKSKFIGRFKMLHKISLIVFILGIAIAGFACGGDDGNNDGDKGGLKAKFSYEIDPSDSFKVNFKNESQGAVRYEWDFGNGNTSEEEHPKKILYFSTGTYTVKLTAYESKDKDEPNDTFEAKVTIASDSITGSFEATKDTTTDKTGKTIKFTNNIEAVGEVSLKYAWNFGDSKGTLTEANPTYTYAAEGTYTVTLNVTGSNGKTTKFRRW